MWPSKYKYDAFISHAVEDKLAITNELCKRLESEGLTIWYSGKELKVGDSLDQTIQKGLTQSRYGVVILSPTYLVKMWPIAEFYLLLAKENSKQKVILPVLYDLTMDDLKERGIHMTDKWSVSYERGMDYVVQSLVDVIKGPAATSRTLKGWLHENVYAIKFWLSLILVLATFYIVYNIQITKRPSEEFIKTEISTRIKELEQTFQKDHQLALKATHAKSTSMEKVQDYYAQFMNLKSYYRNEYEFTNGFHLVRFRKNVESILNIKVSSMGPYNNYNFVDPLVYSNVQYRGDKVIAVTYHLKNTHPLTYEVVDEQLIRDGEYEVILSYKENLRNITVNLFFPGNLHAPKRHELLLVGFLPVEKYLFKRDGNKWSLKSVE